MGVFRLTPDFHMMVDGAAARGRAGAGSTRASARANGRFDERHQRAFYAASYLAAGAGGLAVGWDTTQFAIRDSLCWSV